MLIPVLPPEGLGTPGAAGGCETPLAVVNDQVADVAIIDALIGVALVRDTIFQ
jgi:hypothetical protein